MLASRAGRIAQSPTMKVTAEALKLKAAGRGRRRFRRRRAGLSDAGAHQRRGARRDRRQLHEVHDQLRHRGAEARDRRALSRRTTASSTPTSDIIVIGRRQAGALQRRAGAVRRRRRGHHALAGLADAGRADQARRRDAGASCTRTPTKDSASPRRRSSPRFTPRTRGVVINSPGQPDGRADAGIGDRRFLRKRPRAAASGSSSISATRS